MTKLGTVTALLLLGSLAWAGQSDAEKKIRDRQSSLMAGLKKATSPGEVSATVNELLLLTEEAVSGDLYELAGKVAAQADQIAKQSKSPALIARAAFRVAELKEVQQEAGKIKSSLKALEANADDADANLAVGRFLLFFKGDAERGVAHLAKSFDFSIKAAAQKEIDKAAPLDVGDEWWKVADSKKGVDQAKFRLHACDLYRAAWPSLKGEEREKVRARALAGQAKKPEKPGTDLPAPWTGSKIAKIDERFAHGGDRSVSIFAVKDDSKDHEAFKGLKYVVQAGQELTCSAWVLSNESGARSHLLIRYINSTGDYFKQDGLPPTSDTPFWTKVEKTVTVPEGAVKVEVSFQMWSETGRTWIDDVSLRDSNGGAEILDNGSFEGR